MARFRARAPRAGTVDVRRLICMIVFEINHMCIVPVQPFYRLTYSLNLVMNISRDYSVWIFIKHLMKHLIKQTYICSFITDNFKL